LALDALALALALHSVALLTSLFTILSVT